MSNNEIKFGEFIEEKRKKQGITLRGLAAALDIAPAYMSDIEEGRRYPPKTDKLFETARILKMSEDEKNMMFDLAALAKGNSVSPDLTEYIMEKDIVRVALRKARDIKAPDEIWQWFIEMLDLDKKGLTL